MREPTIAAPVGRLVRFGHAFGSVSAPSRPFGTASADVPGGKTSELLVRLALEAAMSSAPTGSSRRPLGVTVRSPGDNTLQSKITSSGGRRRTQRGHQHRRRLPVAVVPAGVDALAVASDAAAASGLLAEDALARRTVRTGAGEVRRGVLPAAGDGDWVTPHRRGSTKRVGVMETSSPPG
jgi:hypothetical protein